MESYESSGEATYSLHQLISEFGHSAQPRLDAFVRLASAVQLRRRERRVSDMDGITRSVAIWALMEIDHDIADVLSKAGVNQSVLAKDLSISGPRPKPDVGVADLHEQFAWAMREYLAALPETQRGRPVLLADVASAIVRTVRDPRGLLPRRLKGIDVDLAVSALGRFIPKADPQQGPVADPPELSETMRSVAKKLSTTRGGIISAYEIAQAIGELHPEYADGLLRDVTLTVPPDATSRSWSAWRDDVAGLYDQKILASTRHRVLGGRLFLIGLGVYEPALRAVLSDRGVWGPLVLEVEEAVAPADSVLRPIFQAVQFGYGYHSDHVGGDDQLGIQGEVNAVCEVIVDRQVKPPLAVGLFGKWGTGKSFFMEKMRERIAERAPDDGPFKVVQIRFNAWHYADTSLWASLAIEIFERLADPEPIEPERHAEWLNKRGDVGRAMRQEMLAKLQTYKEAKAALEAEKTHLEEKKRHAANRREDARERRRKKIEDKPLTDVAKEVAEDPKVVAAVEEISDKLAVRPAAEELDTLGAELRTTAGYLAAMWRLGKGKTWAAVLATICVVLALATAAFILRGGSLAALATAAGSVAAVVVAAWGVVRPAVRAVNDALSVVEVGINTVSSARARARAKRSAQERELELTLAELDDEIAEATQRVVVLDEKIAAAEADADALTVGRKLYDFLTDRAVGYQKHQGVVGVLHRDFRFLDALLRTVPKDDKLRTDRVVLYIDDLDRCPPAKVLEVLEAVHLLLALELFVVVVGVDPRWLQNSLRHQYQDLTVRGDPRTDPSMAGMPIEYLEKIFQIPFTLPAMEPLGYARLITSIAGPLASSIPSEVKVPPPTPHAPVSESSGIDRAPTRAPLVVQPGSSASGEAGERIQLTRTEIEFAQRLGALVRSPRAAKRLMNTYRLIRATRHVDSRSRFLGRASQAGEYQAVLTLLAVAAGYPAMADRLLVALEEEKTIRTWPDFVRELSPPSDDRPSGRLAPADLADRNRLTMWTDLYEGLASLTANELRDLEPYQRWGRVVARFSFTL